MSENGRAATTVEGRAAVSEAGHAEPQFIHLGTALAVVIVVATDAGGALIEPRPRVTQIVLVTSAIALILLSTVVLSWVERHRRRLAGVVIVGQALLAATATAISGGDAVLVIMPVLSMTVLYGSSRSAALLAVAFSAWMVLIGVNEGATVIASLHRYANFVAAAAFVIVFSRLALKERLARADVERLAREVEGANARLREYAAQVEDLATTQERNRIAREIHDGLGHYLTVVNVQIEAARTVVGTAPDRALEHLSRAQSLTQEGLGEVRRSVAVLRGPVTGGRPLPDVVSKLIDECRASGVDARLQVTGAPRTLTPPIEFTLYRAAQEALTNVRRHARASKAELTLTYDADAVRLSVVDDGVGSADTEGAGCAGFGLLGLRERVQLLGGTVAVRTETGAGFSLDVRVPA